jgi:hypothetical protein
LQSIYTHVVDMAVGCLMSAPVPNLMGDLEGSPYWEELDFWAKIQSASGPPDSGTAHAIAEIAAFVREHAEEFDDLRQRLEEAGFDPQFFRWAPSDLTSRGLYDEVRDNLVMIRDVLTPRVLDLADDPALANLLLELEAAERQWRHMLWVIEHDWESRSQYAWRAVADVYRAAAEVTAHLARTSAG